MTRGRPSSLVMTRLKPAMTVRRAPGPGAIRKFEWTPLAERHLRGRRVVLHTDSANAKSYKIKMEGVYHDSVAHCKKLNKKGGKGIGALHSIRVVSHKMPDGSAIKVKAGTQHVDRAWRFIKARLHRNQKVKAGSKQIRARIRCAQHEYWFRGQDLWKKTGELVQDAMSAECRKCKM